MKSKKILIIAGGGKGHLGLFKKEAEKLAIDLKTASFSELEYLTREKKFRLKIANQDVSLFDLIYIRLVGKRFEDAALLIDYALANRVRIVDRIYEKAQFIRLPLAKSLETELLLQAGIPVPRSFFSSLLRIREKCPELFGFPFVIKGTTGKQGRAVWSPRNPDELEDLLGKLGPIESRGGRFLAQEFIKASQRNRVLVIGGQAVAAITRPTRWRRRFIEKVNGQFPEGKKHGLIPVPKEDSELAVTAAKSLDIDVAGVDIIHEDATDKAYVLEVNSAPRWESIREDTGINPEREIVKFLAKL